MTARWKLAQMSASSASGSGPGSPARRRWRCRATAVFSPLKLKSMRPSPRRGKPGGVTVAGPAARSSWVIRATGNRTARSSPPRAMRSMTGPPG